MPVSKRLRFEVLRRDNHACRYCGATAPAAALTVDHVIPVALGGTDDPANLVAACSECNGGKSSASPDAAVIADVSADAVRWGQAIREAAEILQREMRQRDDLREQFLNAWTSWTWGFKHEEFPLPAGWGTTLTPTPRPLSADRRTSRLRPPEHCRRPHSRGYPNCPRPV